MKSKIFITRKLPKAVEDKLEPYFEINVNEENRVLTHSEIVEGTKKADILLCLLNDNIDAEVLKVNPNLKGVCNYAVGYNNIDIKTATDCGVPVTNTPGVLTETTADMAWALIFSIARRIVEADRFCREERFVGWSPLLFLGSDIHEKTLGIIGAGRIGTSVAKRAAGFNMNVLYYDRNDNKDLDKLDFVQKTDLETLLKNVDFLSLHTPLLPSTKKLIGEKEFQMMKSSAYLINTSRGKCLDEKALVVALNNNEIAGAALDVFYDEPKINSDLLKMDNVVLTPHIASGSVETRTKMGLLAAKNAIQIIREEKPQCLVNPDYKK